MLRKLAQENDFKDNNYKQSKSIKMKQLVKLLMIMVFAIIGTNSYAVSNALSPFGNNAIAPDQGTAAAADLFVDIASLEGFEGDASEFVTPAWLEILCLVSPANFPISTFLTQKVLDGVRGLAKSAEGTKSDILIKTSSGETRFNTKYHTSAETMTNYKQFGENEIKNYKLNWGEIAVIPFQDTVTHVYNTGTTNAYAAANATTFDIVVSNVKMWTSRSLVKFQGLTYSTGSDLVVFIEKISGSTLTVISVDDDGKTKLPVITVGSGVKVTRMGTAHPELGIKNDAVSQYPVSDYNYAQKFITSVVYSNWLMMTQLFTNYSFSMITNLALQDFRYGQEYAFMFGLRSKFSATNPSNNAAETIITTGGLTHFIDQEIEYGVSSSDPTITETDIVDFTKQMRVGNNGSSTRYLFAGSDLIGALNKGVMNDTTRFVNKDYDTVYGLSFTVLYSFFGTINVMYAPLMDQTEYISRGFLLDMQFIDKFVFQPFKENKTDLAKLRQSDAQSIDMMETCGLVVRNIDTHFVMLQTSAS